MNNITTNNTTHHTYHQLQLCKKRPTRLPNYQAILFEQVGFTNHSMGFVAQRLGLKIPSRRAIDYWVTGKVIPQEKRYVLVAYALHLHLTILAKHLLKKHKNKRKNILLVPIFTSDGDYRLKTGENLPLDIYMALVKRIFALAGKVTVILSHQVKNYAPYRLNFDWSRYEKAPKK